MNKQKRHRPSWIQLLRRGDFMIAAVILVAAAILFGLGGRLAAEPAAAAVLVQNGQVVRQWTDNELQGSGYEDVMSNHYHYKIAWDTGKIRFAEADCPDHVCVDTGWLSRPGSVSACVPGGLILKIIAADSSSQGTDRVDIVVK